MEGPALLQTVAPTGNSLKGISMSESRLDVSEEHGVLNSPSSSPVSRPRRALKSEESVLIGLPEPKAPRYKDVCRHIVESNSFTAFTMVLTIWALLGDDLRLLLTQKDEDPIFNWIVIILIIVFGVEFLLSVAGKADYRWSFFFWLDLLSTASLPLDITTVSDYLLSSSSAEDGSNPGGDVRSSKAAKIGAKAGRVVRVLRLVRILKLYKAYYEAKARERQKRQETKKGPGDDDDWDEEDLAGGEKKFDVQDKESRVGRKLSEMTTRRVIVLILAMLLGLPMMQAEMSDQNPFSVWYGADDVWQKFMELTRSSNNATSGVRGEYETSLLRYVYYHNWFAYSAPSEYCKAGDCANMFYAHLFWMGVAGDDLAKVEEAARFATISDIDASEWEAGHQRPGIYNYGTIPDDAKDALQRDWDARCDDGRWFSKGVSLLSKSISGVVDHVVACPEDLRLQERLGVYPRLLSTRQYNDHHLIFWFDLRPFVQADAAFNIIMTFCILVLLVGVSLMFSSDANQLIVHPVERMIQRVESIRDNPLIAMQMADEEFKAEEVAKARRARAQRERIKTALLEVATCTFCTAASAPMETVILEKTIIKLGSLLALGFGEAGANIIGTNMKGGDTAGVDAMIAGMRVECIIGVVRVRNFSVATEVLQSKIMTFVNQIAEIVHGVVNSFHGAPNRNSGESFLVVWRIEQVRDQVTGHLYAPQARKLAGLSVVAFCRILGALHRSPLLATYRGHPGLQYRLGSGCRVNLSFGLHAGWAIEGAVGSEFKIDASYLSPHVNMASRLEAVTSQYQVSILMSDPIARLCSGDMARYFRVIDNVTLKGGMTKAMRLHTIDVNGEKLRTEPATRKKYQNQFEARRSREKAKEEKFRPSFKVHSLFETNDDFEQMRQDYPLKFFQLFNKGYMNYEAGEWDVAREIFQRTCAMVNPDGPSQALLGYMKQYDYDSSKVSPKGWPGFRELTETQ
mmetsp:Transcript_15315/g.44278  ORF Transcript_15315/g.44278 Transcript_15315/m.44278 type:complete len:969 (-) Transcript_15315:124-3030(-)